MGVLTSEQPKCMTEISARETILSRQLKLISESGIKEVVITTGYYDNVLVKYCEGLDMPLHFTFVKNPLYDKTNYIYSIYCAREYLDDDIILMHGDLVFEPEVLDKVISSSDSCMTVSSTLPLPEKDFKANVVDGKVLKVGIDIFNDAMEAQALYKLNRQDWKVWLNKIAEFCESGNTKVYAENALNELNGAANISALDVEDLLCSEIDNPEDLAVVSSKLKEIESRTVYMCFSADIIHGGHIKIIKRAQKLGKLIIGVLSDDVVASYKRVPFVPASERKMLFESIVGVYKVVDQNTLSYKENLLKLKPDIVVHGDDWCTGFQKPIRDEVTDILATYGGRLVEFPYSFNQVYIDLQSRAIADHALIKESIVSADNNYSELDKWLEDKEKVLLVCGESIKYLDKINSKLENSSTNIVRFSDFNPNPLYESVIKGVDLYRRENCDSIIAIGGGSAIDVAKCIKLFSNMPGNGSDGSWLNESVVPNDIPFLAVPTTAGAGSEATRYAVIYYKGEKQSITSDSFIPGTVIMDPDTLITLPDYQKKATMCDVLCHAIESYWSVNSTVESKNYSFTAIKAVLEHMNGYLNNTEEGRAGMLMAANTAGKAINITQTTAGHAMCYKISNLFGVAHGHAAILCVRKLFPWMIDNVDKCIDKRGEAYLKNTLDEIGLALGSINAETGAEKLNKLFDDLGLSIPHATDEQYNELKHSVNPVRLKNHPIALDFENIDKLYHEILLS